MNAFIAIVNLYILMTLLATVILLYGFRHQLDQSARYFLSAELLMTLTAGFIGYASLNPSTINPVGNGLINFFGVTSEVAVLLSILSLYRKIPLRTLLFTVLTIAVFSFILEVARVELGFSLYRPAYYVIYIFSAMMVAYQCFRMPDPTLSSNRFLAWIGIFELGVVLFYAIRLVTHFSGTVIHYRVDTITSVSLYSFLIACNVFRYISYFALRITWVNPDATQTNALNEGLANAVKEKDLLLARLMNSNRMIGISALASSLAHQLSQPLTAISLQAASLKRDLTPELASSGMSTKPLDEICLQSENLAHLVSNLRQLFNSQSFQFQPVNLRKAIDQVIEIILPSLQAKKINVLTQYDSEPIAYGDKIQIQQVMINLLNNAADAIGENPLSDKVISITISQDSAWGTIRIQDTGSGITQENLPKIFELYQSTKKDGLGVGLWLCKTIIDRHRGMISVKSSTHSGTCIEVQLPRLDDERRHQ